MLHPTREDIALSTILHALGDPVRLRMVRQLAAAEDALNCGDLAVVREVPKSTGSYHFRVLREAGLIRMVPQGRCVLVSLRREDVEARFPGLLESILHACEDAVDAVDAVHAAGAVVE